MVTPSKPMPTTDSPMTAPLLNASRNAGFSPSCAFTVVRVFARTAMLIPMYPASAEPMAPIRYAMAVDGMPRLSSRSILPSMS